ncbi:MAG: aminotransferase class V-fold PLP-dependent enzyme [Oscillospiraceae bacterium]|jgi:cysteine desulfurase/selenocysteine lyase|nr:aminotransferase class V-fold PLP-dependent enzyme [Oscillospiraceae bacterium]
MSLKHLFPALERGGVHYLDSAATSMRPESVLRAMDDYYRYDSANPHRGLYDMSQRSTAAYDGSRSVVAKFIGALPEETIFVRNTSEALNLIAYCFAPSVLGEGDNVVIPITEHHSNIVTWQYVCKKQLAELRYLYIDRETGAIPDGEFSKIDGRTKIVAFAHVTNVLGSVNPVEKLVAAAKKVGAATVCDIAQSVPHMPVDVRALGVDFAAFSAHKMYGPMGIGALYGRLELLEAMPPFMYGGDMIEDVREQETDFAPLPSKFEAGTQNCGGAVGFAAAVKFIEEVGYGAIAANEAALLRKLTEGLRKIPGVTIACDAGAYERHAAVSFLVDGVHPHDVSTILNDSDIAVRAGKHCAHPLLDYLEIPFRSTTRASLGVYSDADDIDALLEALPKVRRIMGYGD